MSAPLFFFSYARADREVAFAGRLNAHDNGSCLDAFHTKLSAEVAALTAQDPSKVGFFDREHLDLGVLWPARLVEALRSARVMIALFSPTYFSRPACGREFAVFRSRHEALCKSIGRDADHCILPVLWVRPDATEASIPQCRRTYIKQIQNLAPGMPDCYRKIGLMRMFDLERVKETNEVSHKIADRIYALVTSKQELPALDELDFDTLQSDFHEPAPAGMARPVDRSKREVRVFYLTPTRSEWSAVSGQNSTDFDEFREKARPFSEAPGVTIGAATEEGVGMVKRDLSIVHETLPNDLAEALTDTQGTMTTPLVVFDRRAIRIPTLRQAARSYAARNFENVGFVTAAGRDVTNLELDGVCGAKMGALPKLHNWTLPADRNDYVRNVASIVAELETQLVRNQIEAIQSSGDPLPGLSGPSGL